MRAAATARTRLAARNSWQRVFDPDAGVPAGGVVNATLLCVNDFQISLEMNIEIRHKPNSDFDEKETPERVDILTGVAKAAAPAPAAVATHLDFVSQNDENSEPAAKKARTDA